MSDSVHFRNAKALQEGLKNEVNARQELQGRVASLEAQIAMFRSVLTEMEQQMQVMRFRTTGHGPTG